MSGKSVIERLDEVVDEFARRVRIYNEEVTMERARIFVMQHRQNTRSATRS